MSLEFTKYIEDNKSYKTFYQIYLELKNNKDVDILKILLCTEYNFDVDLEEKPMFELKEKRDYQHELREELLKKYNSCIISDRKEIRLLQVAHIKPVSECKNKFEKQDINNVLLLWQDIHIYFDDYLVSINPDTCKFQISNNIDTDLFDKYNGKKITLSKETKKYLRIHYNKFKNN